MKKLFTYFIQGLLFIAPVGITGYIVYRIFMFTDGLLSTYLVEHFKIKTPGLGILIIFVFLVFALKKLRLSDSIFSFRSKQCEPCKTLEKLPLRKRAGCRDTWGATDHKSVSQQ